MTTIDRQKYVAELGKLLSGMARADREAVLRGVNARFDEAGNDDAVIAALGSPTFAAVSVLRGYTPPENLDEEEEDYEEDDYQRVEPSGSAAAPQSEPVNAAPEAASSEPDEAAPGQVPPEADEAPIEPEPAEYEPAENEADSAPESEPVEAEPVTAAEPEPEPTEEAVNAAPEAESSEPGEAAPGQVPPEADEAPLADDVVAEETAAEDEQAEPEVTSDVQPVEDVPSPVRETVDIGFDTIEVYSDAPTQPAAEESAPAPEAEYEQPVDEAEAEYEESEPVYDEPEAEEPEAGVEPQSMPDDEFELRYRVPEPEEKPKLRGGRVFLSVLLGIIPGIPVAVVLILVALAILTVGAALVYSGVVFISFAFLGMGVVADILLTVGFGLAVAAVGLPIVFFAVWFFLRCVVGLYGRMFAKAGAWCRGEEREA